MQAGAPDAAEARRRVRPLGVRYALAEGAQGFARNGLMSVASVVITAMTLLALGGALAIAGTLDHIATVLERQLQVVVYLKSEAAPAEVASLRSRLEGLPGVTHIEYVSQQQALAKLETQLGARARFGDLLVRNPLPASFAVTAVRADQLGSIAAAARGLPGVEDVRDGGRVLRRLLAVTRAVRLVGAAAGTLLACVALVVISGTVRLTVFARRAEIDVMRLVGATPWFIRWPFVVEGAVTGACGAAAAAAAVVVGYAIIVQGAGRALPFVSLPGTGEVALAVVWKLLLWGVVIGVAASLLALRRYARA